VLSTSSNLLYCHLDNLILGSSSQKKDKKKETGPGASNRDSSGLPDLGHGHIYVDIFEPGLVGPFHVCELGEEELLFGIGGKCCKLGVHLHCLKFLLDRYDKTFYWC